MSIGTTVKYILRLALLAAGLLFLVQGILNSIGATDNVSRTMGYIFISSGVIMTALALERFGLM